MNMNLDQTLSLVRTLLKVLGSSLVTKGVVGSSAWEDITGAALLIAGVVWSHYQHTDAPVPPVNPTITKAP